ncbi:hypothetical protein ABFZ85_11695 [Hyphococcus formosus]|uniref:hypothetical protein n=1 Tax=Hyphococcus formosus TaxID=3143534 RepID=UPI00398A6B08
MSDSRRGRPKGTGLDDEKELMQLAHHMSTNPSLSVASVLKNELGIYHESTIRRLRNKWNRRRKELLMRVKNENKATQLSDVPVVGSFSSGSVLEKLAQFGQSCDPLTSLALTSHPYESSLYGLSALADVETVMGRAYDAVHDLGDVIDLLCPKPALQSLRSEYDAIGAYCGHAEYKGLEDYIADVIGLPEFLKV